MSTRLKANAKAQSSPKPSFAQSRLLQRRSSNYSAYVTVPPIVQNVLCSLCQPLDPTTRTFMEPRFGHDFSKVSVHSTGSGMIQTKLKINEPGDIYEQEADRVSEQVLRMPEPQLQRQVEPEEEEEELIQAKETSGQTPYMSHIMQTQIRSLGGGGQRLSPSLRNFFEPRFGHDFSRVRVHTDAKAAESAHAVNARAFTIGRDVVFGAGRYAPETSKGRGLLAHELVHVVQQSGSGGGLEAEPRAKTVAEQITLGQPITPAMIRSAPHGLYADDDNEEVTPEMPITRPAFSLSWDSLALSDMFQLTPPSLRVPPLTPLTQAGLPLALPARPPSLSVSPTMGQLSLIPPLTQVSPRSGEESETPELPSRLPLLSRGRFSLGLRLGFPEAEVREIPGAPESAIAASLRHAEIMNQQLTGEVPTGLEAVDKSKLASIIWSIFSTHIAPDLARSVTSSLSTSTGPGGVSCELDLVILTDFSGGGLNFTIRY